MNIKVCEMFQSIQGEGILQGIPSVLIRLVGCNLSCDWCDTKDVLYKGNYFTLNEQELLERLSQYNSKYIIITGGEPTLFEQLGQLISVLQNRGYHITVETNGTINTKIDCDLLSISPKLSNSIPKSIKSKEQREDYNQKRINIKAIRSYIRNNNYQIKFVVRDMQEDFDEIKELLDELGEYDKERILIMPQAASIEQLNKVQAEIVRLCILNNMRYANRLQLQIWRNDNEQ